MTHERLLTVFRVLASAIQCGNFDNAIAEIRQRPSLPGHDITDAEIAELMALTLRELAERIKG